MKKKNIFSLAVANLIESVLTVKLVESLLLERIKINQTLSQIIFRNNLEIKILHRDEHHRRKKSDTSAHKFIFCQNIRTKRLFEKKRKREKKNSSLIYIWKNKYINCRYVVASGSESVYKKKKCTEAGVAISTLLLPNHKSKTKFIATHPVSARATKNKRDKK